MAMFAPIPLPGIDNPQFKDVMDYFAQMKEMNQKKPLLEAQTEAAKASALKSKMFSALMSAAFGGLDQTGDASSGMPNIAAGDNNQPKPYQLSPQEKIQQAQMRPGDSMVVGQPQVQFAPGVQGGMDVTGGGGSATDSQNKARQMLYALGMLKETPQDQENRDTRTAYNKELGASDVKAMDKWNDTISSDSQIIPVLENIQELTANPDLQAMYKNPEYLGYDLKLLKRFGTPEQQTLLTSLGTNAKSIFQSMGQEFKGAFREFELNLFNKAAPDETSDTLPQMIAKTNTMLGLRNLVKQRLTLAQNIVRSSGGKISPSNALEIADRQVNGKQVRDQIQNQFKQSEIQQKIDKEKQSKSNSSAKSSKAGVTTIIDPEGNEHVIDSKNVKAALKKYPGTTVKEEGA